MTARTAADYRRPCGLPRSTREQRPAADGDSSAWAVDLVHEASLDGTLPLELLGLPLHQPDGDVDYRRYITAGSIEDLLTSHLRKYVDAVVERARRDPWWVEALGEVWLERAAWERLPELPRQYVPEPPWEAE